MNLPGGKSVSFSMVKSCIWAGNHALLDTYPAYPHRLNRHCVVIELDTLVSVVSPSELLLDTFGCCRILSRILLIRRF
jgi:hypothetical protein